MVLNYVWIGFFLIGFLTAIIKLVVEGDHTVFTAMLDSTFSMAKTGFEISIGLTGVLTLWMGILRIGEKGGMIEGLAKIVGPFFQRLFPEVPRNHPVHGTMIMNFSANMLGLDNAATPIGLKAMSQLQELNPKKDHASNAQIMFLVLNTSGLTIIPVSIMVYRAQAGAENPADIFIPILLATFFSSLAGLIVTSIYQRINLFNRVILLWLSGISLGISGIIYLFSTLNPSQVGPASSLASAFIIFSLIALFIFMAMRKKVNVYDSFIEGAKDGFNVAIKIIPYLVAILVAIGVFRASGAMDYLIDGIAFIFASMGLKTDFTPALPTALMKPLSGSGARGLMVEAMQTYGADSFVGRLTCTLQGATDTTFYVLAVYFGSVNVRYTRHAVTCGLIADFAGIISAILIAYLFFV